MKGVQKELWDKHQFGGDLEAEEFGLYLIGWQCRNAECWLQFTETVKEGVVWPSQSKAVWVRVNRL